MAETGASSSSTFVALTHGPDRCVLDYDTLAELVAKNAHLSATVEAQAQAIEELRARSDRLEKQIDNIKQRDPVSAASFHCMLLGLALMFFAMRALMQGSSSIIPGAGAIGTLRKYFHAHPVDPRKIKDEVLPKLTAIAAALVGLARALGALS